MWRVDDVARLAKWRAVDARAPSSLVAGGAGGVRLGVSAARATTASVDVAGTLDAGTYRLALDATAEAPADAPVHLRLATADGAAVAELDLPPGATLPIVTVVVHAGGPLRLVATLTSARPVTTTVVVSDARLAREPVPGLAPPGS